MVRVAWHARGQGFKSPQLHPRSKALSALNRHRIARLGQQIGSNLFCEADLVVRRGSDAAGCHRCPSPGRPGAHPGRSSATRDRIGRPGTARSMQASTMNASLSGFCAQACSAGSHQRPRERCTAGDRCEPLESDAMWTKRGPARLAMLASRSCLSTSHAAVDTSGLGPDEGAGTSARARQVWETVVGDYKDVVRSWQRVRRYGTSASIRDAPRA